MKLTNSASLALYLVLMAGHNMAAAQDYLRESATKSTSLHRRTQTTNSPQLVWSDTNTGTIEFCQNGGNNYGYRLRGTTTCKPAGLIIRMSPGQDYELTLINTASDETNIHTHGLHISGEGNADDPRRFVDPGCSLKYHWDRLI